MIKKDILETEVRTSGFKKVQDDILQTSKRIEEYRDNIKKLEAQKNRLISAGKQESAEYKNTISEIDKLKKALSQEINTNKDLVKGLRLSELSYNQLKQRASELAKELKNTSAATDPEKYNQLQMSHKRCADQMAKLREGLKQVNREVEKTPSVWSNAFGKIKEFGPAIVIGRSIDWIGRKAKDFIQNSVDEFREYDEALVDAMKTTGLSKDEIKEVSAELAKIDTRTAQNELLGLARVAGKLGIDAPKDVEGFVRAADMINVALSEDLGGNAEQAINEIGKLVDIFKLNEEFGIEDAMIRVGSTINSLGAASTANEGFIVDFTKRLAGTAPNAKIAIENVLGLAAGLDKLGQRSEASSTVISQVISKMFTKPAMFAKLAGMEVKAFTNLLVNDANAAFVTVLKGIQGNDSAMMEIANNLDDMEVRGARGKEVIGALSKDVSVLEAQQLLANKAFVEGTSVIDEYVTKNSSAEAQAEKNKKAITEQAVILGEKLLPIVNSATTGLIYFTKVLSAVIGYLAQSKATIITVTAAIVLYNVQKKLAAFYSAANGFALRKEAFLCASHTAAMKAGTATTLTYTLAQKALITVKALLAGQFKAAGIAVVSFIKSIGPIGWVLTGVTALAVAWDAVKDSINKTTASQRVLNDINTKAQDSIMEERVKLGLLISTANSKVTSDKMRADAITQLQTLIPNGISLINQETVANGKAKEAVDEYCKSLLIRAKLEAAKQYLVDYEKQRLQEREKAGDSITLGVILDGVKGQFAKWFTKDKNADQKYLIAALYKNVEKYDQETNETTGSLANEIIDLEKAVGNIANNSSSAPAGPFIAASTPPPLKHKPMMDYTSAMSYVTETTPVASSASPVVTNSKQGCLKCGKTPCECKCPKCGEKPCVCDLNEDKAKQKWTLDNDAVFSAARVALKKQLLNKEIATDEQYNQQLLAAEISTLEARITSGKEKGEDLLQLKDQLLEKQLAQSTAAQKREEALLRAAQGGDDQAAKTKREYDERLKELGLFNKAEQDMTTAEKAALLQINKEYALKLSAATLNARTQEFDKLQKAHDLNITEMRAAQAEEFQTLNTFEKKKAFLKDKFSKEQLAQITTSAEADKAIKAFFAKQEAEEQQKHLRALLTQYNAMLSQIKSTGKLGDVIFSDEDRAKLEGIIANLKLELSKLGADLNIDMSVGKADNDVDFFGYTQEQWQTLFDNVATGEDKFKSLSQIIGAMGAATAAAMGDIFNLMSAIEERDFKTFEKSQNEKKKALDRQLKSGQISQEKYNDKVQALDEQTDAKKQEMERKQAERQKAMAIFNAIISTAVAVVGALGSAPPGPWNIALAAIIGALGVVQIAAIAAQPLPGAEQGGMLVERSQDGKRFDALYEPQKRGAVDRPTVLVGENGTEYVVPAEGYANPTIRPVLNMIEQARQQGQLKQLNLPALMAANSAASIAGRSAGGHISPQPSPDTSPAGSDSPIDAQIFVRLNELLDSLDNKLPYIKAVISESGRDGLYEAIGRRDQLISRSKL